MEVIAVFTDAGKSARTADRPQFQEMLRFCKARRKDVGFVIVQDVTRFARNLKDWTELTESLFGMGVLVRSVFETSVDESATGKLSGALVGCFAEYFSNSLSEKQKDNTRKLVAAGLFPWKAPIGYINVEGKGRANIVPDDVRGPLIHRAFDLFGTGQYKKSEVLQRISDEGLRTNAGKPLKKQTFQSILRNSLYAGWVRIPSDPDFEPVRGLHQPLISQETFDRVQATLDGRKPTIAPKLKVNPAVPLRSLMKCGACGTPITGGSAVGRGGKKYPRYWCPNSDCLAVKMPKAQLEAEFLQFLDRVRIQADAVASCRNLAPKVWEERQGGTKREMKKITVQLDEHKRLKTELLKMRMRGELNALEFEQAKAEHVIEAYELEERLRALESHEATADGFLRFAEVQVADLASLWTVAEPEQKVRVQNLLFDGGLVYVPEAGILNRSKSSLYSVLDHISTGDEWLVGPPGLEPGTNGL